ncbi:MAG: PEP/pyruvate-binding domain-containing protein [bacterium]
MSNLEADLNHLTHRDFRVQRSVRRLVDEATLMAQELNLLSSDRYDDLYAVLERIREELSESFERIPARAGRALAAPLDGEDSLDVSVVGGKASGLACLSRFLPGTVPPGFTITTAAYRRFLGENNLKERIMMMFRDIDVVSDRDQFRSRIETIRSWIVSATIPEAVRTAIRENVDRISGAAPAAWAVRSSAVDEDGRYSFAGQFETLLGVQPDELETAYLKVLASKFTERAVRYRLYIGIREVEVPMAVLFMPLVDASAAGIIHTSDPKEPSSNVMIVHSVRGLGDEAARGTVQSDTFLVSKAPSPEVLEFLPAGGAGPGEQRPDYIGEETIQTLCGFAARAEESFGHALEMEWAVDGRGKVRLLQARRLHTAGSYAAESGKKSKKLPLIEGGITVFPGQAEGRVVSWRSDMDPDSIPTASVIVTKEPTPELAAVLPKAAAVLAVEGNPAGHASNLAREFSVPCIFRMGPSADRLLLWNIVSVDATNRAVYEGSLWPGMKERVAERIASARRSSPSGPLYDLVIQLNLLDPDSSSFKAASCRSIHDVVRFVHEMSIRSLFGFGDKSRRGWKSKRHELKADLPVKFMLIDLDDSLPSAKKAVTPEEIDSIPFGAFWGGMSDVRLQWTEHWRREMPGVPASFRTAVLDSKKGPRRASDTNYAMIARNYMNLNARFAYHYAMVDAVVGAGSESNHIHFRFRGGGAGEEKKKRRVRFLEEVLRGIGFGTSCRGDMITAWFSRYPLEKSRDALEQLGRLTVCAQQLDAVMKRDSDVKIFAGKFLDEKYEIFR